MSRTDSPASAATSRRPVWCSPRTAATRSRAAAICRRRSSWSTSFGTRSPYSLPFDGTSVPLKVGGGAEAGTWVSDATRDRFMTAYERAFALWPQPYEEFDIETATTTTRVHAYRPRAEGAPIVLLMGAGFNASYWYRHVKELSTAGPVYAIDTPGDPNPSVARAPIATPEASAAWLDEVLGQLSASQGGDGPAHLVGVSYGGWVAMNQAIRAPARVASLTLLDPAGLTRLDARVWGGLAISGLATKTPMVLRPRLAPWPDSPVLVGA